MNKLLLCAVLLLGTLPWVQAKTDPRLLAPFTTLEIEKPGAPATSIVKLPDGSLITAVNNTTLTSRDGGKTWSDRRPILAESTESAPAGTPSGTMRLVLTQANTLVLIWRDKRVDDWDQEGVLGAKAAGSVWSVRSTDGGKTWTDKTKIFGGVCGHPPINLIQVSNGNLVVPVQYYASHPLRCVIQPYVSSDDGKTWRGSNIIDLGGKGDHDGAFEPTLVELRDGRVWMLIRTNWDKYWEAISDDHGAYWRTIRPTAIEASSSPPYLQRLASGCLVLFWNRLYPEGKSDYKRRGGKYSEVAGSWHREEISVATSNDEGATWSQPVIMAREKNVWLSYVYSFEPEPGKLWIFSGQGKIAATVLEADLPRAR
ncbi:sialidase family protein [Oleiharenicola lentus]|uniref:sialidase family protein n=1 Tax=Oleiharenicola lentus TaxID=2508720 RepID=UPI003F66D791